LDCGVEKCQILAGLALLGLLEAQGTRSETTRFVREAVSDCSTEDCLFTSYDISTPNIGLGPSSLEASDITEITVILIASFGNSR
jgi:hypothetical protein